MLMMTEQMWSMNVLGLISIQGFVPTQKIITVQYNEQT